MADLKTRIGKLEAAAGVVSGLDAELQTFLHDLTDAELERIVAYVLPGGGLKVSEAEAEKVLSEVLAARDKRMGVHNEKP
jgi:hypothetical protein